MSIIATKVLKRLREEQPELLKDAVEIELKEYKLDSLNPDMLPSEMKQLADRIARRRLTAPGLSKEETAALMRRIGYGK